MEVKIKKIHPDAKVPQYSKPGDSAIDFVATSRYIDEHGNLCFGLGWAIEIPEGHFGLLMPRSSSANTDLRMSNSVGNIDSGFRGELTAKFRNDNYAHAPDGAKDRYIREDKNLYEERLFGKEYNVGDRVCQLIILPYPEIQLVETDELSKTERGEGGYGSTGK